MCFARSGQTICLNVFFGFGLLSKYVDNFNCFKMTPALCLSPRNVVTTLGRSSGIKVGSKFDDLYLWT